MADKRFTVFIPETELEESHKILEQIAKVRVGRRDRWYSEEELIRELRDVDALIITSRERVTRNVILASNRLRIIAKYGTKPLENVDIAAATEKGIVVTWTPGSNMDSVAEHTIALMLALAKKLFFTHFHLKKGGWRDEKLLSYELLGKTVGIIGLGSIGHAVARKLRGFEVKILAHDPYVTQTRAKEVLADLVSLETLLKQSDFVTVNAALTEDTRHLIGENELKMMKRSAFIVNTSRGALIDERSLYKALSERWIAGAALDVFEEEPARDNLLFGLDNVIVTPHVAGFTYEALRRETSMAAEEVLRVLRGEKPKFLVNPAVFSNS